MPERAPVHAAQIAALCQLRGDAVDVGAVRPKHRCLGLLVPEPEYVAHHVVKPHPGGDAGILPTPKGLVLKHPEPLLLLVVRDGILLQHLGAVHALPNLCAVR